MRSEKARKLLQRIATFFGELKDRRVPHVAIVYAASAFALLEGTQLIFGEFNVPPATFTWLVVVAIAGFPVAVGLSWAYELTSEGVQRTGAMKRTDAAERPDGAEGARGRTKSIAVLPFVDLSPQRDQEYFVDGISEELINALATVEGLKVVSRTSAFAFRDRPEDVREIGRILGAHSVLEGSVRKSENQLRVSTQLVNVADGYQLWSGRYERELADIFSVQDEIASAIVDTLRLRFTMGEFQTDKPIPTESTAAWDHYLKGRHFWYRRYRVGLQTALEYFQAAIAEDPDFADPYAGVADTFISLGVFAFLNPTDALARAEAAAERALGLRPDNSAAHFSMGGLDFFYRWRWRRAEERFTRALDLNPNHAEAYAWWGIMEALRGDMGHAFELGHRAHAVDPEAPYVAFVDALIDFYGRRYDSGQEKLSSVLEQEPELPTALFVQGDVHSAHGRHEAAVGAFGKAAALTNRASLFLCGLGSAWARAGDRDQAEEVLHELRDRSDKEYVTPVSLAQVHANLGDLDSAYRYLELAMGERSPSLLVTLLLPAFDAIRSDPRYPDLERRINVGW